MEEEKQFRIKHYIDRELVIYKEVKEVKKSGTGGSVVLPKELVGKMVRIIYEK